MKTITKKFAWRDFVEGLEIERLQSRDTVTEYAAKLHIGRTTYTAIINNEIKGPSPALIIAIVQHRPELVDKMLEALRNEADNA